jgi:large subunit ribosomal protein L10
MMNREQKAEVIAQVRQNIENARAVFLTNLIGIPSNDSVAIRKTVRDAKGGLVITRNTLIEKAAEGTKAEALLKDLKGPNAVAFAFEDAPAVAKAIYEASKEFEEVINIGGGLLGDQELSKEEVLALAKLPSRDQMLATLLATFNAPVSAFVRTMDAIKRQKEEGGEAPAAAAEETTEA